MATFIEIQNSLVVVKNDNTKVLYTLYENREKVNEQQFNLPEGKLLRYSDGATMYHKNEYCLLRNWTLPDGSVVDRIALRWKNLHL